MNVLNERQLQVIEILKGGNQWIKGDELAQLLNVTSRTIRLDINSINGFYGKTAIKSNRRLGYMLDIQVLNHPALPDESLPQNANQRCVYIIKELLFKNEELSLRALERKLYVSEFSLSNDLKKIRTIISCYPDLKLVRYQNRLVLKGDEASKRSLYKMLLTQETNGDFINLNSIARLWNNFDLMQVKQVLERVLADHDYKIQELNIPLIMIHAGIAIERIINRNYISHQTNTSNFQASPEYLISRDFFIQMGDIINFEVVEDEVILFALLLLGKKRGEYQNDMVADKLHISSDELVNQLITIIFEKFGIDFFNDEDLKIGLAMHLQSLLERQEKNIEVTNIYLQEIKRKYPLIFEMAIKTGEVLSSYCKKEISENEFAFLALHLGAAYDRSNSAEKYQAVMIIPHNQALANMAIAKIRVRFGEQLALVAIFGYFEESMISQKKPDVIITTTPLQHNLDIVTIEVSLFINHEDESQIFQTLNKLDRSRYHHDFVALIEDLVKPELFYVFENMTDSTQVISYLCDGLIKNGLAQEAYKDDVFRREAISATSFVHGFAVPHAIEVPALHSSISIMFLKKPVAWGEFEVRLVILLAINESDNHLLKIFFEWLSRIAANPKQMAKLLECSSYQEFINLVIN